MSAGLDSTWLAKLRAEPWYQAVQQAFAERAIADPLWQSTLYTEDAALDPTLAIADHYADGSPAGTSTGLFMLNANGVGAGLSSATLTDPVQNATIAAQRMAAQLAKDNATGSPLSIQLQSIERAGWNGGLTQDPQRQAALAAAIVANNSAPAGGFDWSAALNPFDARYWMPGPHTGPLSIANGDAAGNKPSAPNPLDIPGAIANATTAVQTAAQRIAIEVTIGAVFLAIVAGGFAIAASSFASSVPVKVNV